MPEEFHEVHEIVCEGMIFLMLLDVRGFQRLLHRQVAMEENFFLFLRFKAQLGHVQGIPSAFPPVRNDFFLCHANMLAYEHMLTIPL